MTYHVDRRNAGRAVHALDTRAYQVMVTGPAGATMQRNFAFHACLGPATSQSDVMALCGIQQLLDAALAGYHVTILAYGQTGEQAAPRV
jgi:Kinesin motor domain